MTRPVIAVARWEALHGDPAAVERGRWIVESPACGYLGLLEATQHDVDRVAEQLRELLGGDGHEVESIGVSVGSAGVPFGREVTAYGPDAADSQPSDAAEASSGAALTPEGGEGSGAHDGVCPTPTRAEMLQRIAQAVNDGLPVPTGVTLFHHGVIELNFHAADATAAAVEQWSDRLGLNAPAWGRVIEKPGEGAPYRMCRARGIVAGTVAGYRGDVTAFVDIASDPSGLEGTGWLEQVWVAATRKGIQAHRPVSDDRTACGRSTRTGEQTTARQAQDRWAPSWSCRKCWPTGSPITAPEGGDS